MLAASVWAQSPEKLSYQSVVRDAEAELIVDQTVGVQISILEGDINGAPVYVETHTPLTNANGLLSLEIGEGVIVNGDFATIDWADGSYFIKIETDPSGEENYTISGTSQLMSVPYALHANTADSLVGGVGISETDPVFTTSLAFGINESDIDAWNLHFSGDYEDLSNAPENVSVFINDAGYLTAADNTDPSASNELQVLSISNDTLFLSDGGFVKIPYGPDGGAENDLISFDGDNWVSASAVIQSSGGSQYQNNMQPYLAVYHVIALQGIFPSRNSMEPFLAEIMIFAGNFAPRGWAFCDGQLLAVSQYSAVFSLVGTTFGGDGRTTFGLPDLRGRTAIHPGQGAGLTNRSYGEKGGAETNIMNINQMPQHTHTITYQ